MARILVVTNLYPPHHFGGYELSCRDVVELWRSWGHDVTVLTSSTVKPGAAPVPESRRHVRRDLHVFFDGGEIQRWPTRQVLARERHNQAALQAALDALEPDVVSVWHMAGMSLSLLHRLVWRGVPIVGVVCDEWPGYVENTDQWMRLWRHVRPGWRLLSKLTGVPTGFPDLGQIASFCFVTENLRDRCLKKSAWYFPRSTVTYSGIDTRQFPVTGRVAPSAWRWQLAVAGRLDHRKGFATAVEALARLPLARLRILSAADEPYRLELERLADRLGVADRVQFSVTDRAGVRAAFEEVDAVVFPSVWEEPFGLVPLEAMACGTPVVATGTGGSAEFLVDGGNCLLFRAGDADALACAVGRLAASGDLREHLVGEGLRTAAQLTVERLAAVLEDWHLAAVDGFRDGVPGPPRDLRRYAPGGRRLA